MLLVPMRAPLGRSRNDLDQRLITTSRGSSLFKTAIVVVPAVSDVGKSFRLCTAISIRSSINACSNFDVKAPIPNEVIFSSGNSSPVERILMIWKSNSGLAICNAEITAFVWINANLLPLVPMRIECRIKFLTL